MNNNCTSLRTLAFALLAANILVGCRQAASVPDTPAADKAQATEEGAVKRIQNTPELTPDQKVIAIAEEHKRWERMRADAEAYAKSKK